MRILYGVVGEGMGHAIRSKVVLEHLVQAGHDIEIMVSGRASQFLAKHFAGVNEIHGFHMIHEDNRVRVGKTLLSNIAKGLRGVPKNILAYFELVDDFAPDVVISDFESWTYTYGKLHNVPVYSVDNMQMINRCRHEDNILAGVRLEFELTRTFVKSKLPFCDHYWITSFAKPAVCKERTTLFPPILRPEILAAQPSRGDHVLVYQTGAGNADSATEATAPLTTLARELEAQGLECRVYGARHDEVSGEVVDNIRYQPFSEAGFIHDLASARAVIASAGFTLMGEAVYLGKPMLAIPLGRQFEQQLNARYLEACGYGLSAEGVDDRAALTCFLDSLDDYGEQLADFVHDQNVGLLEAIDERLK